MLRPLGYGVKLVALALTRFLFKMLAVQRTGEDTPERVGEPFERIGHVMTVADSVNLRKAWTSDVCLKVTNDEIDGPCTNEGRAAVASCLLANRLCRMNEVAVVPRRVDCTLGGW
jgi:hypothetical protein